MQNALQHAEQLVQNDQWREAVDVLSQENQQTRNVDIERSLVDCRIQAHAAMQWPKPTGQWAGEWEFPLA